MDAWQTDGWPARTIAGFWRRLGAFIIDLILLGIVGLVLGWMFFDPLARMGFYARLIGFAIALAYFGILNSRIGGGQTLAKRWLGVRVVDANDQLLSLPRSLLRYAVLGIPFFCNGLPIVPGMTASSPLVYLLGLVVFGSTFATLYLYIFNRRTRQSLHDLAVGSYVERFDRVGQPTTFPGMWRGHFIVAALLVVLALGSPLLASRFANTQTFAGMLALYETLIAQPHVLTAQVGRKTMWFNGNVSHTMQSVIRLDAPLVGDDAMARHIAQLMAKGDPDIAKEDDVVVTLVYGYDMGIASGWKRHGYSFKPEELR
ncbi:RDD family protein [Rhodanobacter sp. L36]|uniref:RDD family protein n=1 Tax=Rhodanobacter sp. L36 TaxID=1747221 RepID=UPI00131D3338|nr:RDD family protein [Rhodanobacter sp. L36]